MRTTIDAVGRLVIPKEIRRKAGLTPGAEVDVRYCQDGRIEIEPAPSRVKLVREGRFLVARVEGDVEPMTEEDVEALIDQIRNERGLSDEDALPPGQRWSPP